MCRSNIGSKNSQRNEEKRKNEFKLKTTPKDVQLHNQISTSDKHAKKEDLSDGSALKLQDPLPEKQVIENFTNELESQSSKKEKLQEVEFVRELKWKFHFPGEQKEKSEQADEGISSLEESSRTLSDSKQSYSNEGQEGVWSGDFGVTDSEGEDSAFEGSKDSSDGQGSVYLQGKSEINSQGVASPKDFELNSEDITISKASKNSLNQNRILNDGEKEVDTMATEGPTNFSQEKSGEGEGLSTGRILTNKSASNYYRIYFPDDYSPGEYLKQIDDDERKDFSFASENESLEESNMQGIITNDGEEGSGFISEKSSDASEDSKYKFHQKGDWGKIDEGIRSAASEHLDKGDHKQRRGAAELEVDDNFAIEESCDSSEKDFGSDTKYVNFTPPVKHNSDAELQLPIEENIVKADSSETTEVCRYRYINKDSKANNKKTNIAASCFLVLGAPSATIALSLGLYKGHFGIIECILVIIAIVSVCTAALIKSYSKVKSYLSEAKSDTIDPLTMVQN